MLCESMIFPFASELILTASATHDIDFRVRGKYANVAGPYLPPPLG
jgi:hypothetical protein